MPVTLNFQPRWVSAPGDTLRELLQQQKLSRREFAERIGSSPEEADHLLDGTAAITDTIAERLQETVGGSAKFWRHREAQFRRDLAILENTTGAQWVTELPLEEMTRFGWIPNHSTTNDQLLACMNFFGVREIDTWRDKYGEVIRGRAFRTSPSLDSQPAAVAVWLRRAEIEAASVHCERWDRDGLVSALQGIRSLTRQRNPDLFLPELKRRCAKCGVAVVILRAPSGCRASGATWFLSPTKAVVVLSFRYLSDDHFWFTFYHEAGHLVLHEHSQLFLEGTDVICTKEEEEANEFAATTLLPSTLNKELLELPLDGRAVIKFARRVGISPGIVVGQLQHCRKITHRQLNSLKTRFRWIFD